jgi:hypothetical protein
LKGPITKDVHTRVHQLKSKFFPTREPEAVQDGICYLKVIIDSYHCNARPSTAKVKKSNSQDYTCTCERQQEEMFPSFVNKPETVE